MLFGMLIPSAFGSGLKQPPLNQSFKHAHNCNLSLCHHFCSFHELMISILIRVILTFQSHSICIVRYSHALPSNKLSWLTQIQHCSPYFHIYIYMFIFLGKSHEKAMGFPIVWCSTSPFVVSMGVSPPGQLDLGGVPQRPAEQVWNGASSAADAGDG
jgi:hypothetical protein